MAEGLLRNMAGERVEVFSAGVAPTHVRPEAVAAMKELGIDISGHRSKSIDEFAAQAFDHVITVCDNANQHCPTFAGPSQRIHWNIEDPAAVQGDEQTRLDAFRQARDQLQGRLRQFLTEHVAFANL